MHVPSNKPPAFIVIHFELRVDPAGRPSQDRQILGRHARIDTAFVAARLAAVQCLFHLRRAQPSKVSAPGLAGLAGLSGEANKSGEVSGGDRWKLEDTEWGYDVRQDGLVVHRFWVHDVAPNDLGW